MIAAGPMRSGSITAFADQTPEVRATSVWKRMADWGNFDESATWKALKAELLDQYAQNLSVDIWGPSPVVPEPLRPG
jgi:hypothetical protein